MEKNLPAADDIFTLSPAPHAWPMLFKFRGPVLGKGFVALVEFQGRLLARCGEAGVIVVDGVNPGGFALQASNIRAVSLELRSTLAEVLIDFAEDADSFGAFKLHVEEFFRDTDPETAGEWEACVAEVQSGRLQPPPGLLPVEPANSPLVVKVTLKPSESVTPKDNSLPEPVLASVA